MARNDPVQVIQNFLGLNNVAAPEELDEKEFTQVDNVDVTDRGKLVQRTGFAPVEELGECTDLGGDDSTLLFVRNGSLYTVSGSGPELVRAGLQGRGRMSYAAARGAVYYTNGVEKGVVLNGTDFSWGQAAPADSASLSIVAGSGLQSGIYQVVVTALSDTGEESPPTRELSVSVDNAQGLQLDDISTPAGAAWMRIYCTTPDGSEFHLVDAIPAGTSTRVFYPTNFGRVLDTFGMVEVTPGDALCFRDGRMYIAVDKTVWVTQPYRVGLIDPRRDFFQFKAKVNVLMDTDAGVFVGTEKGVQFLAGTGPADMKAGEFVSYPIIPGTQTRIPSERFKEQDVIGDDIWIWLSERGFHAGMPNGEVLDLTQGRVDIDAGSEGAGTFLERKGASMYVGTVKNPGADGSTFGFGDRVVAEVFRNGVPV